MAKLIDEVAGRRDPNTLIGLALALAVSTAALTLLSAGLKRWKNVQWTSVWHTQNKIFLEKLLGMDYAAVNDSHIQDLRFQVWQNSNSGAWGLHKLLFCFEAALKSILSLAGAILLTVPLFTLSVPESGGSLRALNHPLFVLLFLALMLAITFLAPSFSIKAGSYWVKLSEEHKMGNRLFAFWLGELGSDLSRAMDVRIYRQDKISKRNLEENNPFRAKGKLARASQGPGLHTLSGALSQLLVGISYLFVCLKALGGAFTVGSATQYVASITALSASLSLLASTLGELRNNTPFLRTVFEFLDTPHKMHRGCLPVKREGGGSYEIEFRNVTFRYPGQKKDALRHVSLVFHTGERLAVVGRNGSGKTTFIKLLCRLYDPTEGVILLNGIDIREYDYQEYFSMFSVVFQDFKLLSFGLGQNVAAKMEYDEERAERCLGAAGFGERLSRLPQGLSTVLYRDFDGRGIDVSGGEAQKIALARALYQEALFLILDEPTAALDPVAEFEVYGRMNEIAGNKTAVFISHRLSSCRFCRDIAVFQEGRLIQRGSHTELVRDEAGEYYKLWNAQAQYYAAHSE